MRLLNKIPRTILYVLPWPSWLKFSLFSLPIFPLYFSLLTYITEDSQTVSHPKYTHTTFSQRTVSPRTVDRLSFTGPGFKESFENLKESSPLRGGIFFIGGVVTDGRNLTHLCEGLSTTLC